MVEPDCADPETGEPCRARACPDCDPDYYRDLKRDDEDAWLERFT